jgi:hypothetical protein
MPIIEEIFEGIKLLIMAPADFYVKVENGAGTKAIISTALVVTYCGLLWMKIPIPGELVTLVTAATGVYFGHSISKS